MALVGDEEPSYDDKLAAAMDKYEADKAERKLKEARELTSRDAEPDERAKKESVKEVSFNEKSIKQNSAKEERPTPQPLMTDSLVRMSEVVGDQEQHQTEEVQPAEQMKIEPSEPIEKSEEPTERAPITTKEEPLDAEEQHLVPTVIETLVSTSEVAQTPKKSTPHPSFALYPKDMTKEVRFHSFTVNFKQAQPGKGKDRWQENPRFYKHENGSPKPFSWALQLAGGDAKTSSKRHFNKFLVPYNRTLFKICGRVMFNLMGELYEIDYFVISPEGDLYVSLMNAKDFLKKFNGQVVKVDVALVINEAHNMTDVHDKHHFLPN